MQRGGNVTFSVVVASGLPGCHDIKLYTPILPDRYVWTCRILIFIEMQDSSLHLADAE